MLLEDIYNFDMLNEFQRAAYTEIAKLLRPIDEAILDHYQTGSLVMYEAGEYHLEMAIKPRTSDAFRLLVEIYANHAIMTMEKLQEEFSITPESSESQVVQMLTGTIQRIFTGEIKLIVEIQKNRPVRWTRFDLVAGQWQQYATYSTLLRFFFGEKSSEELRCKVY